MDFHDELATRARRSVDSARRSVEDARGMTPELEVLTTEAQSCVTDLDGTQAEMLAAIEAFAAEIRRSDCPPALAVASERLLLAYAGQVAACERARGLLDAIALLNQGWSGDFYGDTDPVTFCK